MAEEQILTFSENSVLAAQLLGKAYRSTGSAAFVICGGIELPRGVRVDQVIKADAGHADAPSADEVVRVLTEAVRQYAPRVVLVGATKLGLEAAPRAAERLGCGYAAWAQDFVIEADGLTRVWVSVYSGMGTAEYHFAAETVIMTVPAGLFEPQAGEGDPLGIPLKIPMAASTLEVLETIPRQAQETGLEKARAVVDIGRGIKTQADIPLAEQLAQALDASLACSRPLASDLDWFEDWLGLSGQVVAPELLLAVGVSGAAQHIVGIRKARVIVAVNQDENAAIFTAADYGVVADLYAFLPLLTERLKQRQIHLP